jgi:hypothetical protein
MEGSRFLIPVLCHLALLRGPGGDLLSRVLGRSTIGAEGFHGRVRDGIGCGTLAMATRPSQQIQMSGSDVRCQGELGRASVPTRQTPGFWHLISDIWCVSADGDRG